MRDVKALLLIGALALAGLADAAFAAPRCESEGGMGGTGKPAVTGQEQKTPGPAPTGGMGGTGITASAGVVGVVTGFASICVNGAEVFYGNRTPVEINGRPAAAKDLERGQVVRVEAQQTSPNEYRAARIAVLEAVVGPVTRVDAERRVFWVMGQPVRLVSDAVSALSGNGLPALKSSVRVSGLMNARGELLASRVEGVSPNEPVYLMANIAQVDRRVVHLGWVRVELPAGAERDGLQIGQEVAVRGRWDGEGIVADRYWVDPRLKFAAQPKRLSLEGYVFECDAPGRYALNGIELRTAGSVVEPAQYVGKRVVVQGALNGRVLTIDGVREQLTDPAADKPIKATSGVRDFSNGAFDDSVNIRVHCGG